MKLLRIIRSHPIWTALFVVIAAVLLALRLYLTVWVLHYVNYTLNHIEGYEGSVKSINIDLYRGAYRINHLHLYKKSGHIPTPFISIEKTDLSIQWSALLHGRIVSHADLYKPVINFAKANGAAQNGAGVDWTKPIKDLSPIDINYVTFRQGEITYQDFSATPKVDIYIHHMDGELRNLRNVTDKEHPLPSTLELAGDSLGGGKLKMDGRLNILKPVPDMDVKTQLVNASLPAFNNYSDAYAAVDIKSGEISVYSEVIVKDNQVSGYIKPIATHVSVIDLHKDANPVKVAWESAVAVVLTLFTNISHDQIATVVPLQGRLDNLHTDVWATVGGILHNAFVSALKKELDVTPKNPA